MAWEGTLEMFNRVVPYPLAQPRAEQNLTTTRLPFVNAKTALYYGGRRLWNQPVRDAFNSHQSLALIPGLNMPGDITEEFPKHDPIAVANTMQNIIGSIRPKLWDETTTEAFEQRRELLEDLLVFLHAFSKLESGTGMDARRLAEAWIPYLIQGEATEEKLQELTIAISGIEEE